MSHDGFDQRSKVVGLPASENVAYNYDCDGNDCNGKDTAGMKKSVRLFL